MHILYCTVIEYFSTKSTKSGLEPYGAMVIYSITTYGSYRCYVALQMVSL